MPLDPAHTQDGYDLRFEWGPDGVAALGPSSVVVVVVDVLRFTTAVDAAVARGVAVYPARPGDDAAALAAAVGAIAAGGSPGPSLSPLSFGGLPAGTSVVLPSPNGSACSALAADDGAVVAAGCLRNADALAGWLNRQLRPVTVIACGE